MIELIVFDVAGTTIDEDNVVYKTVRDAVVAVGSNVSLATVLSVAAVKEKSEAIRDVLELDGQQHSDEKIASIFQDFKTRLAAAYEALN
ncbi:MAG: HAD family hydrolase, partial [Planctomycetota bacterium]